MKTTLATGMTLAALLLGSAATAHPLDGLTGATLVGLGLRVATAER